MTPVIVTPPADPIVLLDDLTLHLRLDHDDDLPLVEQLGLAAEAHLDGWAGLLGRCVKRQTWKVSAAGAGVLTLPMPDVIEAAADYGDGPVPLAISISDLGPAVTVSGPCEVSFTCALPERLLSAVKVVVKMLVAHWYANREAVSVGGASSEVPMAAAAIIAQLRWSRV